jgi:hypothetical protein
MYKSLLPGACVLALLAGCATAPRNPAPVKAANANATLNCPATGSRVAVGTCGMAGRSYSGEQLERTGATDPAHALSLLDPSITVGR